MEIGDRREAFREFTAELLRFESLSGEELAAQHWIAGQLEDLGFDEVLTWTPDEAVVLAHLPLTDPPAEMEVDNRPIVAGIMEFGEPDAGPTLVFNGHVDVVPTEPEEWTSDPFEPVWDGDHLTARGSVDMKSGLAAGVFAAVLLRDAEPDINGRVVVESVPGEEDGGVGAIASAYEDPYPFDRDGVVVTEATDLILGGASAGSTRHRLEIVGKRAHPGRTWEGESVLPHFCRIYQAFLALEKERARDVVHPFYSHLENPWPMNVTRVQSLPDTESVVPDYLRADFRIGVSPSETMEEVSAQFQARLDELAQDDDWLREHRPTFERTSYQIIPGAVEADDPLLTSLSSALHQHGHDDEVLGYTGGADTRFFNDAGIPAVLFGPAAADSDHGAHTVDETVQWSTVETTAEVLATMASEYLNSKSD